MSTKLMHAIQYDSYGGGPSGLKVPSLSAPILLFVSINLILLGLTAIKEQPFTNCYVNVMFVAACRGSNPNPEEK